LQEKPQVPLQVLVAFAGAEQQSTLELQVAPMPPHTPQAPLMQVVPAQHCELALHETPLPAHVAQTPP
jgi:hypothetical protein